MTYVNAPKVRRKPIGDRGTLVPFLFPGCLNSHGVLRNGALKPMIVGLSGLLQR